MIHPGMLGNLPQSKYGQEVHPVLPTAPQDRRENSTPKPPASQPEPWASPYIQTHMGETRVNG